MSVSYNRLWKLLIDRNMNKVTLRDTANLSTSTLARMGKNQTVSMDALCRICDTLNCGFDDIVEYIKDRG